MTDFNCLFRALTGHEPFPWQRKLYDHFLAGEFPTPCDLPTGLGKTSVIPIWLLAFSVRPDLVPRRLVYVVNRRTVVDQATLEARNLRERLGETNGLVERLKALCAVPEDTPLAISTLRGQFADNAEWRTDPSRPAVIVGTVDMVGSRLLFGGYGLGFKTKPLHAGFLGQDVLLVHDEAHLEPAFQKLAEAVRDEQGREPSPLGEGIRLKVMELTATTRGAGDSFELTPEEKSPPDQLPSPPAEPIHFVWQRLKARKELLLQAVEDEKKLADKVVDLAKRHDGSGCTVLVYLRRLDDVDKVVKKLPKDATQQLTGTLRGYERDRMANEDPIFRRFLPNAEPGDKTVYLVCTSAGEVGVNISADHLICDLSTFESMAQRLGRVNRFGYRDDTLVDIVYPQELDDQDPYDARRKGTLELLRRLGGDGSPHALGQLDPASRLAAFSPQPTILLTSDILFDSWALTTVKDELPGRPPVEPYLHGIEDAKQAETLVAWRDEVWSLKDAALTGEQLTELIENYPLKPHELLRDSTYRKRTGVRDQLARLAERGGGLPVWIQEPWGQVYATTLESATNASLAGRTVILPPEAGGLPISNGRSQGLLDGSSTYEPGNRSLYDVADALADTEGRPLRLRQRTAGITLPPKGMRRVLAVRLRPELDEEDEGDAGERELEEAGTTHLQFFTGVRSADDDGSKTSRGTVALAVHSEDVGNHAERIVSNLALSDDLKQAVVLSAKCHDLGKSRSVFQRSLGNMDPCEPLLAKSAGKTMEITHYRHEIGSLLDVQDEAQFQGLSEDLKDLVLHLIAAHHGRGRPHFPSDEIFDPEPKGRDVAAIAAGVPRRFARLQRKYGRWGLAYLESLVRAADYAASANPTETLEDQA